MPSKSNLRIHLITDGDVVLDQLISCAENANSPAISYLQIVPSNGIEIFNPFLTGLPSNGFLVTGLLIVPDRANTIPWNITAQQNPPFGAINYHPTNPAFLSFAPYGYPLYMSHAGVAGTTITFQMFWI